MLLTICNDESAVKYLSRDYTGSRYICKQMFLLKSNLLQSGARWVNDARWRCNVCGYEGVFAPGAKDTVRVHMQGQAHAQAVATKSAGPSKQ